MRPSAQILAPTGQFTRQPGGGNAEYAAKPVGGGVFVQPFAVARALEELVVAFEKLKLALLGVCQLVSRSTQPAGMCVSGRRWKSNSMRTRPSLS